MARTIALLGQIVADETFEVIQLSVGNENRCMRAVLLLADVQQFNALLFPGQTLERQFDIRKALELDLEPQPVFKSGILLGLPCGLSFGPQLVDLAL